MSRKLIGALIAGILFALPAGAQAAKTTAYKASVSQPPAFACEEGLAHGTCILANYTFECRRAFLGPVYGFTNRDAVEDWYEAFTYYGVHLWTCWQLVQGYPTYEVSG